jgi:hypothetical protein
MFIPSLKGSLADSGLAGLRVGHAAQQTGRKRCRHSEFQQFTLVDVLNAWLSCMRLIHASVPYFLWRPSSGRLFSAVVRFEEN